MGHCKREGCGECSGHVLSQSSLSIPLCSHLGHCKGKTVESVAAMSPHTRPGLYPFALVCAHVKGRLWRGPTAEGPQPVLGLNFGLPPAWAQAVIYTMFTCVLPLCLDKGRNKDRQTKAETETTRHNIVTELCGPNAANSYYSAANSTVRHSNGLSRTRNNAQCIPCASSL